MGEAKEQDAEGDAGQKCDFYAWPECLKNVGGLFFFNVLGYELGRSDAQP